MTMFSKNFFGGHGLFGPSRLRLCRRLFHLNIGWLMRKDAGESGPHEMTPVRY